MYLLEAGKMLFCFCWGVPVLFPVLTEKENGSVRLCFVPYFCLLIIHLYNCGSSTPGIHTYLSPSSQKPLLDEAGKGDWKNSLNPYKSKEPLYVFENRTPSNFDFFYTMNRNFKTSWIGCLSYYSHDFFLKCRIPLPQYQVFYIISGFRQLQNIFKYIMSHADLLNELLHGPQGLILSIKKKSFLLVILLFTESF